MEVRVLAHMPFARKQMKPGDLIPEDKWMAVSDGVRSALISQGLVRVGGGAPAASRASENESSADVIELLQGISAKQDRTLGLMEAILAKVGAEAPAPTTKARKPAAGHRKPKG